MPTNNSINANATGLARYDGAGGWTGVTVTNHNALVGAASNGITSVAPSATSGVALISQGAAADPAFGTVEVAGGGTGVTSVTAYAPIVGGTTGTGALQSTAVGSAGQILQSAGNAAVPTYSTATYPATAGTSGNVLTSDGTNFISQAPAGAGALLSVSGQLTSAQIKALHATPIQVIAAPGAGMVLLPTYYFVSFVYGGSNVFVAAASQTISLYYGTTTSAISLMTSSQIAGSSSTIKNLSTTLSATAPTNFTNAALNLYNPVATEISGNAANDNVVNYQILYYVASV